jgi:hypothetical protein
MGEAAGTSRAPSGAARARLRTLIGGYRLSQAIYVATRLGIPDLLADGPRDSEELAQLTHCHPQNLGRVLLALAAAGVLDKVAAGRFALTEVGVGLCAGVPGSLQSAVLFLLSESHWRPWGQLLHSVRTGETAFEHVHGASLFAYLAGHPEEASLFNKGMAGNSPAHARLVAAAYDFSRVRVVVDVAGGRGRLLATILARNPHLRGILFDLPHVIEDARGLVEQEGVIDRCEFVGGSFFAAVPDGGDAYILRNIIHDWQDDQAVAILTTCRRAMADAARLILVERYLPEDPREALSVRHADLEILVNVGGRERTTEEYAVLLARSGLRLSQTISLGPAEEAMGHYLIEARPALLSPGRTAPA